MNERIKELAEQAELIPDGDDWFSAIQESDVRTIDLERFAELVRQDEREQAEKQEPVAWMVRDSIDGSWYACAFENPAGTIKGESTPLYTAPPRKEWVGLTGLEVSHYNSRLSGSGVAEEIESKLKERNT